jgi:hypothetical protein
MACMHALELYFINKIFQLYFWDKGCRLLLGGVITGFSLVKSRSKFLTSESCLGSLGRYGGLTYISICYSIPKDKAAIEVIKLSHHQNIRSHSRQFLIYHQL